VAVPEHDPGKRLDFEVAQGLLLFLREIAHLRLGELDIVEVAPGQLCDRALDVGCAQPKPFRRPVIELLRQGAHCLVATGLDFGKDALHRGAHLGVGGLDRARVHSALEIMGHGHSSAVSCFLPAHSIIAALQRANDMPASWTREPPRVLLRQMLPLSKPIARTKAEVTS